MRPRTHMALSSANLLLGFALCLSACTMTAPAPVPPADPPPEPNVPEAPARIDTPPAVTGEPVAVVIGSEFGDYLELSYVFAARLARPYRVYELGARSDERVLADVERLRPSSVIALGPSALALASRMGPVDVVYAGVPAGDAAHRGVDALPPFGMQLDFWRSQDGDLKRLGVIASAAMRDRVAAIAAACAERGVELDHHEVSSDRELLLAFRGMVPRIDGFVILPDARVLSPDVIRRIIAHGRGNGLDILVYSPAMYELGASVFVQSEPVDVASQVVALIHSGERYRSLTRMRTQTRPVVAAEVSGG